MDTIENIAGGESQSQSDKSLAISSLSSLPTLFVVALLIPAAAALSNQWLLANLSSISFVSYAIYPWMALSAAALSWTSGRYLHPAFLRCVVFVWCLTLLDLLTFMACLYSTHDSQFGYMLVSAQINLLILWTILGSGGWQWRLPIMLAVAPLILVLQSTIGSTWWLSGGRWFDSWFSQSWQWIELMAAIVGALVCAALRWLGFSLEPFRAATPDVETQALGISQFGVKHMLVWSAAVVPLLLIARSLDFLFIKNLKQNELFPITLLSVSLATVSLVAIWVVLGAGKWFVRLPFLFLAPFVSTVALEAFSRYERSQFPSFSSIRRPIVDLYLQMTGSWFAWIWQGTALLAALLLFVRASGYRFVRKSIQTADASK